MYGNIPWEDGNIAFQEAMDQREDQSIPTSFIMKVLSVVLSCNVFEFLGKLFIQLFGVAMGSRVAPTYACIFMGWLEKKMLLDWTGLNHTYFCGKDILMIVSPSNRYVKNIYSTPMGDEWHSHNKKIW